jgi:hypothetical protein
VARLRAYLHDRHALLADISARNEGHAPKCADWDLKATRKIEGWRAATADPRLRMKAWPTTSLAPIRPARYTCDSRKEPTCIERMGEFGIQFCWAEIQELDVSKVVWTSDGAFPPPLHPRVERLYGPAVIRAAAQWITNEITTQVSPFEGRFECDKTCCNHCLSPDLTPK